MDSNVADNLDHPSDGTSALRAFDRIADAPAIGLLPAASCRSRPSHRRDDVHRILSVGTVGAIAPDMPSFEAARSFDLAPTTQAAAQGRADSELLPLAEVERRHILEVLSACHGNRSVAAKALGIDRKTLYRQLKRFEIEP